MKRLIYLISISVIIIVSVIVKNKYYRTSNSHANSGFIDINIDTVNVEKLITYSSVFDGFNLVELETKEECMIGRVSHIEVFNDTIYILDRDIAKSIFAFNKNGSFIKKIGSNGKGPGEYIRPKSFSIDNRSGQIIILDYNKVIRYDKNGRFLSEKKLRRRNSAYIACLNGNIYLDHVFNKHIKPDYYISSIDSKGNVKDKWLKNRSYQKGFQQTMTTGNSFTKTPYDLKYNKFLLDTIFRIHNDKIEPYIVFSSENKLTNSEVKELNKVDIRNLSKKLTFCEKFTGIQKYNESSNLIMIQYKNNKCTHTVFYWPNKNQFKFTKYPIYDDLTLSKRGIFYSAYNNNFISTIENDFFNSIELFKKNVLDDKINISKEQKKWVSNLNSNSNPIIVFYKCRDNILKQEI